MWLPIIPRFLLEDLQDDYRRQLRQLNNALADNGVLRRRVQSLELENTELRRRLRRMAALPEIQH